MEWLSLKLCLRNKLSMSLGCKLSTLSTVDWNKIKIKIKIV